MILNYQLIKAGTQEKVGTQDEKDIPKARVIERFEMNVIKIILWMIAVFFAARGIYILAVTRGGSEWLPTVGLLMFARDALIAFSLTLIGFAIQYFSKFKLVRKESDNGQN